MIRARTQRRPEDPVRHDLERRHVAQRLEVERVEAPEREGAGPHEQAGAGIGHGPPGQQALGLGQVLGPVGVEERVDRRRAGTRPWPAGSARSRHRSCACPPRPGRGAARRPGPPATGRRPGGPGRRWRHRRAAAPSAVTAASRRAARSRGKNGVSVAMLSSQGQPGRCAAAHSRPVRMPASGPAKPGDGVGDDGQAEGGEAGGVAVGVEHERRPPAAGRARSHGPGSAGRRAGAGTCRRRPCAATGRRRAGGR